MRNRMKLLYILCAALAISIAGMIFVIKYDKDTESKIETIAPFTNYASVDELVLVGIKNATGQTLLVHKNGNYLVDSIPANLVNQKAVQTVFESLLHVTASSTIAEGIDDTMLAEYGLDNPGATVTMMDATGSAGIYMLIGDQIPGSDNYYFYVPGISNIYEISGEAASNYLNSKSNYLSLSFYPNMADENIKELKEIRVVSKDGNAYSLEQTRLSDIGNYAFYDLTYPVVASTGWQTLDEQLLLPLESLCGSSFVAQNVVDFAQYGLDDPDYTLELDYLGTKYRVLFSINKNNGYYATTEGSGMVFEVESAAAAFLTLSYTDILGNVVIQESAASVNSISLEASGSSVEFNISGVSEALKVIKNDSEIDSAAFLKAFELLNEIYIEDEYTKAQQGDALLTIRIRHRAADRTDTVVSFFPISDRYCSVSVNNVMMFSTYTTSIERIIDAFFAL